MINTWCPMYSTGDSTTSRPLARTLRIISKNGQPWRTFQITLGMKTSAAAAPPSQIHGWRSARRAGVSSTPTTSPIP